jgi:hypothetical protein
MKVLILGTTGMLGRAVIEKGFIKLKNFRNIQNKLAYPYYLTPKGMEENGDGLQSVPFNQNKEFTSKWNEVEGKKIFEVIV